MKLYELKAQFIALLNELTNPDATYTPELIKDSMEGITYEFNEKAIGTAGVIKTMRANAAAIKQARQEMEKREKALLNRADYLEEYLLSAMRDTGNEVIECPWFKVSVAKNPVSVAIAEGAELHPAYIREKLVREPDKAAIKEALQNGATVPGCSLQQTYKLNIR